MEPATGDFDHLRLVVHGSEVPLGFARDGPVVYLAARERAALWPVELLRVGWGEARTSTEAWRGRARLVVGHDERQRALDLFRAKYGAERFARWYADPARLVALDLGEGAGSRPTEDGYRRWLEAEFDNVAEDYDRHIFGNRINRLLRDRSLALLRREFARRPRLLEIGCGSGVETVPLLEDGHEIVAVDLSAKMLEVVRAKARRAGRSEQLTTVHRAAGALGELPDLGAAGVFDGAYSTYGALNCEADLGEIPAPLHRLLAREGRLVVGVYNRWCAFETVGYGLTGAFARASGRWSTPVAVGASRFCVDVFAHSPWGFRRRFAPWFRAVRWEGVPVLLPPSDLVGYAERFARRFDRLASLDRTLGRWPGFRSVGDHFLMVLEREDLASGAVHDQDAVRAPASSA